MTFEHRLIHVKWAFLLLMLAVPLRLATLQWGWRQELNSHPNNSRLAERVSYRGRVSDRNGQVLAISQGSHRNYPQGALTAHWTGFYSGQYGLSGIERWKQELLRERREVDGVTSRAGHSLKVSLDVRAQRRVQANFPPCDGAALLLDLDSGQVLAAVSQPGFEPSRVGIEWKSWQRDPRAPLLNRCFLGLYPAGELWKVWQSSLQSLPSRPVLLMDWTSPQQIQGQWLVSPGQIAAVLQALGSSLPLSQLRSDRLQKWAVSTEVPLLRRCDQGLQWSQVTHLGKQHVCWAVVLRRPYVFVSVWEQNSNEKAALKAAWKSLPE